MICTILYKIINMYVQLELCKIINMYVHGTYMVCTFRAINMYVHCSDVYIHVYTCTYTF